MSDKTKELLEIVRTGAVLRMTLSGPLAKANEVRRVDIEAREGAKGAVWQAAAYTSTQVFHTNFNEANALADWLAVRLPGYRQTELATAAWKYSLLQNKKGTQTLKRSAAAKAEAPAQTHNRQKAYVLREGFPVPWLVSLGVMLENGVVPNARQKKFRQINHYLSILADFADGLSDGARIVDAGCGRSYLTFALYDYLTRVLGKRVSIVGLDLKADVVAECAALAERLGFEGLCFRAGDLADYEPEGGAVDMVVSLHACDTATDYALYNAVRWGAKVILAVPCCQHELFGQVKNDALHVLLKHGILKERFAALMTDALRAELLTAMGYTCAVMEFIELEHTPKNLLLRAVLHGKRSESALKAARAAAGGLCAAPTLLRLLEGDARLWPSQRE